MATDTVSTAASAGTRLSALTGDDATDILDAAVQLAGGRLMGSTLREIDHRPGGRVTASYTTAVSWNDRPPKDEILAATVAGQAPSEGLVVSNGDHDVQVWRYPYDPELPALAAATFPHVVAELLQSLGLDAAGVRLNVVTYRPRKRAVVEVTTLRSRLFLKVLRPSAVRDIQRRHHVLAEAGIPVPRCLSWSDDGLLVLDALDGRSLRSELSTGRARIDPGELVALLDRLPPEVAEMPRRDPWAERAAHFADVVAAARPVHALRVRELGSVIGSRLAGIGLDDEPTHGDFYDAQVFSAGGSVTGLLDIDTAGPGSRADDLACALAHLSVLTTIMPYRTGAARTLAEWLPVFETRVDAQELRLRAAGVVLSLATGPFRAQEAGWEKTTDRRIELVEQWIAAAGRKPASEVCGTGRNANETAA